MKAIVADIRSADGTGPDDYDLEVGQTVEVVGFVNGIGSAPYAVIAAARYLTIPAWYLTPITEVPLSKQEV